MWRVAGAREAEQGLPVLGRPPRGQALSHADHWGESQASYNSVLVWTLLLLVVLGMMPASMVLALCAAGVMLSCISAQARSRQAYQRLLAAEMLEAQQGATTTAVSPPSAAYAFPVLMNNGGAPLVMHNSGGRQLLNLHLSMLNRELTSADYELLAQLDSRRQAGQPVRPVSDVELARLPVHRFRLPKAQPDAAGQPPQPQQQGGADGGGPSVASAEEHVCTVCLEPFAEGVALMTLPCLHRFHCDCITPWLQQQGLDAVCPMCKTRVFT